MIECVTYKAKALYTAKFLFLMLMFFSNISLWIVALNTYQDVNIDLDLTPFCLMYSGLVVVLMYFFWAHPYKIERKEDCFVFFMFGKTIFFLFNKDEFLRCGRGRFGGRIFYFKKRYRTYWVDECVFPDVVKIMEGIYLEKPCKFGRKKGTETKVMCLTCGRLYERDMSRCLWCDAPKQHADDENL